MACVGVGGGGWGYKTRDKGELVQAWHAPGCKWPVLLGGWGGGADKGELVQAWHA